MSSAASLFLRVLSAVSSVGLARPRRPWPGMTMALCLTGAAMLGAFNPRAAAQGTPPAAGAASASIAGVVRDSAGAPVEGAEVSLSGFPMAKTATDGHGVYVLGQLAPGSYRVMVRRLGFRPATAKAIVATVTRTVVDIVLERAVWQLPGVEVRDTGLVPLKYRFTTRYDAFFAHRATATSGVFIDRAEMDRRGGVAHALSQFGGVKASENMGTLNVILPRCTMGSPAVIVDGVLSNGSVLSTIPVSSIELIEVYRSIAEMPVEARGNGCGAIVIYMR